MKFLFSYLLVVFVSGCSTTKLVDHWQDKSFSRNDINNVLIVGVTSDSSNRFLFENTLETAMTRAGLKGITSIKAIGEEFPKKERVEQYVKDHNIDYIVAIKVGDVKIEKDYVPPTVRTYYTGPYYASYSHYYSGHGTTVTLTTPAYVDTRTTIELVTTIFDAKTGSPVWIGRTETFEPHSINLLAEDIAKSVWKNIDP